MKRVILLLVIILFGLHINAYAGGVSRQRSIELMKKHFDMMPSMYNNDAFMENYKMVANVFCHGEVDRGLRDARKDPKSINYYKIVNLCVGMMLAGGNPNETYNIITGEK